MAHILELSRKAQDFYEKTRGKSVYSGYERNVLIREDFDNCLYVDSTYVPQPGDTLFRCRTLNQQTVIELKIQVPEAESLNKIALKGKFTGGEWLNMISHMNGILRTPGMDPRDELAGEMESSELLEKIKALTKVEAEILLREIETFWNNPETDPNKFVGKYL